MKRLFVFLPFVLIGAGCADTTTNSSADVLQEELTVMQEMMEEMLEDLEEAQEEASDSEEDGQEMNEGDEGDAVAEVDVDETLLEDEESGSEEGEEEVVEEVLEPLVLEMTSGNFFFTPSVIEAQPGQEVTIGITENKGVHTFVIDEIGYKKSLDSGTVLSFTAPETPGSYAYYCDIGSHRALGMEGTLIVK